MPRTKAPILPLTPEAITELFSVAEAHKESPMPKYESRGFYIAPPANFKPIQSGYIVGMVYMDKDGHWTEGVHSDTHFWATQTEAVNAIEFHKQAHYAQVFTSTIMATGASREMAYSEYYGWAKNVGHSDHPKEDAEEAMSNWTE